MKGGTMLRRSASVLVALAAIAALVLSTASTSVADWQLPVELLPVPPVRSDEVPPIQIRLLDPKVRELDVLVKLVDKPGTASAIRTDGVSIVGRDAPLSVGPGVVSAGENDVVTLSATQGAKIPSGVYAEFVAIDLIVDGREPFTLHQYRYFEVTSGSIRALTSTEYSDRVDVLITTKSGETYRPGVVKAAVPGPAKVAAGAVLVRSGDTGERPDQSESSED